VSFATLALLVRAMREESRQLRTYYTRLGLALVILVSLITAHLSAERFGAAGLRFFTGVVYINFVFISLAAIGHFASAITEEKEEMTLGLLRMTSLSPVSILLGKSVGRLWLGIGLLLAQFPFTVLAIPLGGVSRDQIVAAYLTLLAYLLMTGAMALAASVVCRNTRSSARLTLLLLLFFLAVPVLMPIAQGMAGERWIARNGPAYAAMTGVGNAAWQLSPIRRLGEVLSSTFAGGVLDIQVAGNAGLGLLFFLGAWGVFDVFTREQKQAAPSRGLVPRASRRLRFIAAGRAWRYALVWKDFNFLAGGLSMTIIKFVLFALLIAGISLLIHSTSYSGIRREQVAGVMMITMFWAASIEAVLAAARVFREEVRWKTLPCLMMLPISVRRLAFRKAAGCLLGIIPAVSYFVLGIFLAPDGFADFVEEVLDEPVTILWFVSVPIFVLYLVAYASLVTRRWTLALAALAVYFGSYLFFGILSLVFRRVDQAIAWIGPIMLLVFVAFLHRGIKRRLVLYGGA
jgi:ABC-type transport system involved in multi-copper enzyme maturation permease subunit